MLRIFKGYKTPQNEHSHGILSPSCSTIPLHLIKCKCCCFMANFVNKMK